MNLALRAASLPLAEDLPMKTGVIAGLAVFALVLVLGSSFCFGYIGFGNTANNFENQITAQFSQNKNVYDNGWKKVREVAQVPDMYADKVKEVFVASIQGRYGDGGAKATFLALKEANPQIDASLYAKVQLVVEQFHDQFEQNQARLISIKQEYQNYLNATTSGRFYNNLGHYPRLDLSKYEIVTSDKTETDFTNRKAAELNLKH